MESPLPSMSASWAAVTRRMAFLLGSWWLKVDGSGGLRRASEAFQDAQAALWVTQERRGPREAPGGRTGRCRQAGRRALPNQPWLLQLPRDEELVEDVIGLVEVEDEVQLAHVAKVPVQHLCAAAT